MNIRTNPIVRGLRCHWPKAVAVLALGMSLGGTAYASGVLVPPASVGSVQLKRGAVTAPKLAANAITAKSVKRGTLLRADFKAGELPSGQGPQGPQGPRGRQGSNGTQGPPGTNGSPAFGAVLGRGVNVPAGTSFLAPSGQLTATANENNVSSFTPNATTTASDLAVTLTVGTGLTDTRTFTLRVGNADTALTCTVPPGNTGCTSTRSVTIPGGSLISIGSTSTGTPDPTDVRFGWRASS